VTAFFQELRQLPVSVLDDPRPRLPVQRAYQGKVACEVVRPTQLGGNLVSQPVPDNATLGRCKGFYAVLGNLLPHMVTEGVEGFPVVGALSFFSRPAYHACNLGAHAVRLPHDAVDDVQAVRSRESAQHVKQFRAGMVYHLPIRIAYQSQCPVVAAARVQLTGLFYYAGVILPVAFQYIIPALAGRERLATGRSE
jgi:hypothetical protein